MSKEFKYSRTVFVLDISGSMCGMKSDTMLLTTKRLIEDMSDRDYVGIVSFGTDANIEHRVVQITDKGVRNGLIEKLPEINGKYTNIGSGLLLALIALTNENLSTEGATIRLITDGGDTTTGNYVDRVLPTLLAAKVKIICMAVGNSADENLDRLARETAGNTFKVSDSNREMAARVMESTIQEVMTSTEMCEVVNISVCNDLISISQHSSEFKVIIDSDIGQNTIFKIESEDVDKFSVIIKSPNGLIFDTSSNAMNQDLSLKRYQLKTKSTESGVWTINFSKHSNRTLSATVIVTSQPLNPNAIQMRVKLKDANINSETPPIIIAELRQRKNVIIGAEVTAIIEKPNGTQTDVKLYNYNNIYCNYFTDYCGSGRYNVSVLAKNGSTSCRIKPISGETIISDLSVYQFQRQCIAGCFKVDTFMPSKPPDNQTLQQLSMDGEFSPFH